MVSKRQRAAKKAAAVRKARQAELATQKSAEVAQSLLLEQPEEEEVDSDCCDHLIEAVETLLVKGDRVLRNRLLDDPPDSLSKFPKDKLTSALNQCFRNGRLLEIQRKHEVKSNDVEDNQPNYLTTPKYIESMDVNSEQIVPYADHVPDTVVRDIFAYLTKYDMHPPNEEKVKDDEAIHDSAGFSVMQTRMLLNLDRRYLNYTQQTIRDKVFARARHLGLVESGFGSPSTPIDHLTKTFRAELGATIKPYDQTLATKLSKLTILLHNKPIDQIWYDCDFVEKTMCQEPLRPLAPKPTDTDQDVKAEESNQAVESYEIESPTHEQAVTASSSASSTPATSPRPHSGEETGTKRAGDAIRTSSRKRSKNTAYSDDFIGSYNELLQHRREIALPKCCICLGPTKTPKKRPNLTEDFVPVIQCHTCNNVRAHLHCLRIPNNISLNGLWKCCTCGNCVKCTHTKRKDFIINCKICTRGYHVTCLTSSDYNASPFMCVECYRASLPTKAVPKVSVLSSEQSLLVNRNRTMSGSSLIATRPINTATTSKSLLQQQQPSTSSTTVASTNHVSQPPPLSPTSNSNPNSLLASVSTPVTATKTSIITINRKVIPTPTVSVVAKMVEKSKAAATTVNGTLRAVPMSAIKATVTTSLVASTSKPKVNGTVATLATGSTSATTTPTSASTEAPERKKKKKKNKDKVKVGKDKENNVKKKKKKKKVQVNNDSNKTNNKLNEKPVLPVAKKSLLPGLPNFKSIVSPAQTKLTPKVPKVKDDFPRYLENEMKHSLTQEWYRKLRGLPKKILDWTSSDVCIFSRAIGLTEDEIPKIIEHNVNGTALVGMMKNELREHAKLTIGSVSKLSRFTVDFTKTFEELVEDSDLD